MTSLVELLRSRADREGAVVCHRFLRQGTDITAEFTYGELDRRARAAAVHLRRYGNAGDRVLLLYPAGLDFLVGFFGSLYAGMIPVPAYPPRPSQSDERISAIAADAGAVVAATEPDHASRLPVPSVAFEKLTLDAADEWRPPRIDRLTVAHLQYTSGSTAVPKGVMVTHGNILSNMEDLYRGWDHDSSSTVVSWLPAFHDMGLVYGLLTPIYGRIPCILMPPVVFLQRPIRWLQAITRFRGTHSAAPNFAYDHCAKRVKEEDIPSLDLSGWRVAVNGAEPIRPETMDRFCACFATAGFNRRAFVPGYGLAEATLKVTARRYGEGPLVSTIAGRELVACGAPILETRVVIVDPATSRPVKDGQTGEIWVGGPSVAAGYWQRADATEATFAARTASGDGPFLRTGDLGLMHEGQLYVAGRIKDVLIIRGQNYYPQDVEASVERSGVPVRAGSGAAFSVERDGEERLVIAYEVDRSVKAREAPAHVESIRAAIVRDHELHADDVVLLRPGGAPKTSSGKIRRRACRDAYLEGSLDRLPLS